MFSGLMDTMNETFEALDNPLGRGGKTVLVVGATAAILGGLFWYSKKARAATAPSCASWRTPAGGEMTPSVVSRANQLDSGANLGKEYVESYDGKTWKFNVVRDPNNAGQTDVWVQVCAS